MNNYEHHLGKMVRLITDPDNHKRMVTQVNITTIGCQYELAFGSTKSWHYDIEVIGYHEKGNVIGFS